MITKTLLLRRLSRFPAAAAGDELVFSTGVNVMVGEKDSGKSTWLRMLDYLMGDSGKPSDAFGETIEAQYESIEAELLIGSDTVVLRRSWSPTTPRTKMLLNSEPINVADLSDILLQKLGIPRLNYPKGDPYSEKTWPALTFRTLFRHIYRQERFWSDFADKQPAVDQHAALALFLGVAEVLFPAKFGELVGKQKKLFELQAKREVHESLLNQIAADLVRQKEISVSITEASLSDAERRLKSELTRIEQQRSEILSVVKDKVQAQWDQRAASVCATIEQIVETLQKVSAERQKIAGRLAELRAYAQILGDELARFARAKSVGKAMAQLRVTHCPVCDQEAEPASDDQHCFLCHRPYPSSGGASGSQRIAFEEAQLREEREELDSLIENLVREIEQLDTRSADLQRERSQLETALKPTREFAISILPPDLTLLDQAHGRTSEQLETLARVRKSLELQNETQKEIAKLQTEEDALRSELRNAKADVDLRSVGELFEDRINDYFNFINRADPGRWKHGRVSFQIRERTFELRADEKLGATSQALLLFAYHYALLSLVADNRFFYPGLTIVDFPLRLADGATTLDKENYLIEPFVALCARDGMGNTQVIAAGHSFDNLNGANQIRIARPTSNQQMSQASVDPQSDAMSAFPNWRSFVVHQRRPETGCIPTSFEVLLRAAGAKGIDFGTFQDDFDLDKGGGVPRNNFLSVASAVSAKYPHVKFELVAFASGKGAEKLSAVETRIAKSQPVVVSIAQGLHGPWHIMPVVDVAADSLTLLEYVDASGQTRTKTILKSEFVRIHDEWDGGKDIAFLLAW